MTTRDAPPPPIKTPAPASDLDTLRREWQRILDGGFVPADDLRKLVARSFLYLLRKAGS